MRESFVENRRNSFYGAAYRRLMRLEIMALALLVVLLFVFGYVMIFNAQPKFYASTLTGREVQIYPLSEPVLTNTFVRRWAGAAARSALNLSFSDYQQQLKKASQYFTKSAWEHYSSVIDSRGLLSEVSGSQLVVSAIVTEGATILYRQIQNGRYTWRIQVPLLVGIQTAGSKTYQNWIVTMTVVRVSTLDTSHGILISQIKVS